MEREGILGIDAGGTFTDLAFLSLSDASVVASAKVPTDHDDLVGTIGRGLDFINDKVDVKNIKAISLATTFATNAIVEGKTCASGLVLIGYDKEQVQRAVQENKISIDNIIFISGGHDTKGNERELLDLVKLRSSIKKIEGTVKSIAVSGFFSVRNPSHEIAAREEILSLYPDMIVTCGNELSSDLNAILRATTTLLNAGLIHIVMSLLDSVERVLKERGIDVPLSVVRGDGSHVSSEWAKSHPIEMIVSGPAASAVGAAYLGKAEGLSRGSWVVDVGGTTTDIIHLDEDGNPAISANGASVGRHKTLIKAIDIFTIGLGGDSRVVYTNKKTGEYEIGPGRVRPLCSAVSDMPGLSKKIVSWQKSNEPTEPLLIIKNEISSADGNFELKLQEGLNNGFISREALADNGYISRISYPKLEDLNKAGLLEFAGFTPTDALHVLKKLDKWDGEASQNGAEILSGSKLSAEKTAEAIYKKFVVLVALNIFKKSMMLNGFGYYLTDDAESLIIKMLLNDPEKGPSLKFKVNSEIIGIGAPAWAFIKEAAELLGEDGRIPANAEVAGAVGAVVSSFSMKYSVWITPMKGDMFRVHLPVGIYDFVDLETAVDRAEEFMAPWITERAKKTGAIDPIVKSIRVDEKAKTSGGAKIHLWTELLYSVKEQDEHFL